MVSALCYWRLLSRISVLDAHNRSQLNRSPYSMPRVLSVDSLTHRAQGRDEGALCETIHLSLVCMGQCTRHITPMLKSLLHHRQNPLHFHLIVDFASEKMLNKFFDTWDLPDVKYSCYNAQYELPKVAWIPNSHYSGVYSFFKLLYTDVLPKSLEKVIVLDSDLTFLSDVAELWSMFKNMTDEQLLGLVENESNWYYEADRWPALGRGFNTGVMLLNLRKIHTTTNWTLLWREAVNFNIKKLTKTSLGDQDVINAIIHNHPQIVYNIGCQYNVQMSTQTLAKNCYGQDMRSVKIIHWNSPRKYAVDVKDADFFRNSHLFYVNIDGNLLKKKLHRCYTPEIATTSLNNSSNLCVSFHAMAHAKLRTHIYYMDYAYNQIDAFDVTLVLQLSMDRLHFFERFVKYWEGPISAAIYLSDCELKELEVFIQEYSSTLSMRRNIGYHLVFKHDSAHYPVNYLRNVALEHVNTPYVFLMDVDFVPMGDIYQHLRQAIKLTNPYPQKKCLVVPAFETARYRASPPRTKMALLARLRAGRGRDADVAPFRLQEWPKGHRATNYSRWIDATKPYEVDWEPDYEPYLVVHRTVPLYDTRFSGFGWNKVSHIVELRAQGFKAVVLPDAFVVHTTHAPSAGIVAFRANKYYRICLAQIKQEFLNDLTRKYNVSFDIVSGKKKYDEYADIAKNLFLNEAKDGV
ncbi:LARGE xylosyl- and glucuronyltransferase 1-like [Hyposmocoma kahamanoa]|uniref:LARGE xylosyl- and glucuronyltransferase 1-like n=1 Tax=Hyposmocoma kahamanoa TaxID=1477025 RepID=UPI000E6D5B4D|nr:LARGE xylosyl- and glucuronyltransferase 1-like [Hyposmocoma kahamanoa]